MPLVEIVLSPRHVVLPVFLIVLYMGGCVLSCVNTGIVYQNHKSVIPEALVRAHLAFCVVGFVAFFCLSALFWLWSAKYSHTRSERTWRLFLGVWAVSVFKDLPLFVIESVTVAFTGWWDIDHLQGACYIVQIVYFTVSITVTGMSFSWYASGVLERCFGSAAVMPLSRRAVDYRRSSASPALVALSPPALLKDPFTHQYSGVGVAAGDSPMPQPPPRASSYEANYAQLNQGNPTAENMFFSEQPVQSPPEHSRDIPPAII